MKAKPMKLVYGQGYFPCGLDEVTHVKLRMPGPLEYRMIPVILKGTREGTHCWSWNGDTERPTLKPSIPTTSHTMRCHTFVNDGQVQFLSDCSHELSGQTLPLLELEE